MKGRFTILAALVFVLAVAGMADAGLIGSKHDMSGLAATTFPLDTQGKAGPCSYCHIPHKATGAKAWSGTPGGTAATIGTVGTLCYNCHGSTGLFGGTANVSATIAFDMTNTGSHGLTNSNLVGGDSMAAAGLPYTASTSLEAGMIQCSSCHDAHNDATDPFLQSAGTDINTICTKCHQNRTGATAGYANTGTHPSNNSGVTFKNEATAPNHPTVMPAFMKPYRDTGQTPTTVATEQPWLAGPHTADGGTTAGATSYMVCVSCHAVHGVQAATQTIPTIAQATETGRAASTQKALIPVANSGSNSGLCEACHTTNPGGILDGSHPVNVASLTVGDVYNAPAAPFIVNPTNKAICRQCHGVHLANQVAPAVANTPILVAALAPASPGIAFCSNCHAQTNTFIAKHHPADVAWAGMGANATAASPTLNAVAWGTGTLTCYNCHFVHNAPDTTSILRWAKETGVQGSGSGASAALVAGTNSQGMCVACHTVLPGVYSANDAGGKNKSSHFVGTISVSAPDLKEYAFKGTYLGTSAVPKYNGTATAPVMICQSCHTLAGNGVVTTGTPPLDVHLLSDKSSNTLAPTQTSEVGLCRTCHVPTQDTMASGVAGTWGTGFQIGRTTIVGRTHPLNKRQDGAAIDPTKYPVKTTTGNMVTYTANTSAGQINCESCHVAHSALEGMGGYILEDTKQASYTGNWAGTTPTDRASWFPTTKNEAGFCLGCHTQ
jgi:predicted CXXCH cytochrome family protein